MDTRSYSSLRETVGRIRQRRFTTAIDYQGLWKSAMLSFLGGVSRRIGFSSQVIREFGVPVLYTDRVRTTRKHVVEQNGELSLRAGVQSILGSVVLTVAPVHEASVTQYLRDAGVAAFWAVSSRASSRR